MEQRSQTSAQGGRSRGVNFKTKPEIAPEQIAAACAAGLPRGVVLMNAAYGNNSDFVWRHHSAGVDLRRRYSFEHYGMGSRRGAAVGPRHGQVGAGHLSG
jgi:SRSO17 transposase